MPPFANLWLAPMAPVLRRQGGQVRGGMPSLPEARGPRHGSIAGAQPPLQLLFLGESTMAGVGVERMEDSLPALLAREVAAHTQQAVCWRVFARSGLTVAESDELLEQLQTQHEKLQHVDAAVIAMGVSDTISFTTPRRFASGMHELVERLHQIQETPGTPEVPRPFPVLLAGVPRLDRFQRPLPFPLSTALGRRCRSLDQALTQVAAHKPLVLHWPVFQPPGSQDTPEAFASDGFHPGPKGYRFWARHLALGVATLLEELQEPQKAQRGGC